MSYVINEDNERLQSQIDCGLLLFALQFRLQLSSQCQFQFQFQFAPPALVPSPEARNEQLHLFRVRPLKLYLIIAATRSLPAS